MLAAMFCWSPASKCSTRETTLLSSVVPCRLQIKAKAQALATALATIGKFIIKKKVGENDQIFGRWDL